MYILAISITQIFIIKTYLDPYHVSKIERLAKAVND